MRCAPGAPSLGAADVATSGRFWRMGGRSDLIVDRDGGDKGVADGLEAGFRRVILKLLP